MSRTPIQSRKKINFLNLSAYLTLAVVGFAGILDIPTVLQRWIALGCLILIGVLIGRYPDEPAPQDMPGVQLALGTQTALTALLIYFSEEAFTFCILFFVLSVTATLANSPRLAVLWLVIFTAITGYFFIQRDGWGDGVLIWLPFVGGYFFFGVFASALRRANQAQRESAALLQELRLAHQKLQEYAGHVEALAVAQERNRMAREMHDTLGHRLTVASVQLEGAQRLIERDPTRASQMVGTVREQVREALKELRQAVARLREPLESDLPLNQSLPRLATSFQEATGLPVHLALPESLPMLPASHCQALYRAAQEGLTNIQRHAQAGQAWLEVSAEPAAISLAVSDDGTGYPGSAPQGGFGLAGLFERAAQLGGEARLEQRQGGGARLIFTLPLDSEAEYG